MNARPSSIGGRVRCPYVELGQDCTYLCVLCDAKHRKSSIGPYLFSWLVMFQRYENFYLYSLLLVGTVLSPFCYIQAAYIASSKGIPGVIYPTHGRDWNVRTPLRR